MKEWLIDCLSSSTFNTCPLQPLIGMTGPDIELHVDLSAKPKTFNTPAMVFLHWQKEVKEQIKNDVALGVLEKVLFGELSAWCHRMVITRKADGSPRRTLDPSIRLHSISIALEKFITSNLHPSMPKQSQLTLGRQ